MNPIPRLLVLARGVAEAAFWVYEPDKVIVRALERFDGYRRDAPDALALRAIYDRAWRALRPSDFEHVRARYEAAATERDVRYEANLAVPMTGPPNNRIM